MINALNGLLVCCSANSAVIMCGGVEYSVSITASTASMLSSLSGSERSDVRILTYLQHSDDSMILYGFRNEEERRLFTELIKVSGISYKQALKILSGVRVNDFITALDKGDVKFLSGIPGLGTKTAQKLILALRDKVVLLPAGSGSLSTGDTKHVPSSLDDLVEALTDMGYERRKVNEIISSILKEKAQQFAGLKESEIEEQLFRLAIVRLS